VQPLRGCGETILVVEDDADVRQVIFDLLVALGYRVTVARHGREALRIYRRRAAEIDLVLTDLSMPEMDGEALIADLIGLADPPVLVVLSGQASPFPLPAWSKAVAAWIKKPADLEELGQTLAGALNGGRTATSAADDE
jgi:CheY-like chemotaxis protein